MNWQSPISPVNKQTYLIKTWYLYKTMVQIVLITAPSLLQFDELTEKKCYYRSHFLVELLCDLTRESKENY